MHYYVEGMHYYVKGMHSLVKGMHYFLLGMHSLLKEMHCCVIGMHCYERIKIAAIYKPSVFNQPLNCYFCPLIIGPKGVKWINFR